VEEFTEQVVDATHPFCEALEGGSFQEQRVTSLEMALHVGPQKGAVFSQLVVLV
jgi:hypothetical protein